MSLKPYFPYKSHGKLVSPKHRDADSVGLMWSPGIFFLTSTLGGSDVGDLKIALKKKDLSNVCG